MQRPLGEEVKPDRTELGSSNGNAYLDRVVAGNDAAILYFHVCGGMSKLAFRVGSSAFVALKLSTDFELKPARILNIK